MYFHPKTRSLLVIYVDDFRLASPEGKCKEIWDELRKTIKMDDPGPAGRFLGCYLKKFECTAKDVEAILANKPELRKRGAEEAEPLSSLPNYKPNTPVRGHEYDMSKYLQSNVERYCSMVGLDPAKLKEVVTP